MSSSELTGAVIFFTKQQKITVHNNMFFSAGKMFYSAVKVLQSGRKLYSVEKLFYKLVRDLTVW